MRGGKRFLIEVMKREGHLTRPEVARAFERVPREHFVLPEHSRQAYADMPLPIMAGQTISQPSTVAIMAELLDVQKGHKVFEVGTGSGYQAAILSEIVGKDGKIITTEIVPAVLEFGKKNLKKYKNVSVLLHDGSQGYVKKAPYDRIIITAAAPRIPDALKKQLKAGGKLVAPVGSGEIQVMTVIERVSDAEYNTTYHGEFAFVPMKTGLKKV